MKQNIEIRRVETGRDRKIFLTFPWKIYRDDPLWVPPVLSEMRKRIDPQQGAFFERGEAELFIAWRDGQPVGTISAAVDHKSSELLAKKECVFGFFEYIEDRSVFDALLAHVDEWAKSRGLETLFGPFNLDYEDAYGVLVEGRDCPPVLSCGHTPTYYLAYMESEAAGFKAARGDNLAFRVPLVEDTPEFQQLSRLADRVRLRKGFTVRAGRIDRWDEEVDHVYTLINAALKHLEDHIPWQREALQALLWQFRQIADPELILFAEDEGKVVGFLPGLPNLNETFIHTNGLRTPWDYVKLLWLSRRRPDCVTIKSVLVLPEYWGTGLSILLFDEMIRRTRARGFKWMDLSLTSEENPKTPQLAGRFGGEIYKRYRTYRRKVG